MKNKKNQSELGYLIDPYYRRLQILQVGDAGANERCFLVEGKPLGAEWRDESELLSVHLEYSKFKIPQNCLYLRI